MKNVLMIGVHPSTKGGMWTVVDNYLNNDYLSTQVKIKYLPTATNGSKLIVAAYFAIAYLRVLFTLIFGKVDLVHIHSASKGSFYRKSMVLNLAKRFNKPAIIHLHGAGFENFYDGSSKKGKSKIRSTFDKADVIICLGESWRRFLEDKVNTRSGEHVVVLYNAVEVPAENLYNQDSVEITFLGELCKRKGIYDLVEAVNEIKDSLSDNTKIALYGKGDISEVQTLINNHGLGDKIEIRGYLKKEGKCKMFSKTLANVLPSYNEGLPMTILEMMAHGIPNITTAVGAIEEAVEDCKNGLIVVPGDTKILSSAIIRIIEDVEMRKKMSAEAYESAKCKFSMQKHIEKLLEIYSKLEQQTK